MPLLMKHTGPLWGIWKIEESSEVLLSLLRNREEYLPQLELIRTEQRRREWLACRGNGQRSDILRAARSA